MRESPLAWLLGVANRPDTPTALRHVLVEAIQSLKPDALEPPQSSAWRLYELLFYSAVQHFSQWEVADQLGISTRQVRREQRAALEVLASQLWAQYNLPGQVAEQMAASRDETVLASPASGAPVYEDLLWLREAPPEGSVDPHQELGVVLELAQPLAVQRGVRLEITHDASLPELASDPVAFRQSLLSVLGAAIPRAAAAQRTAVVQLQVRHIGWEVEVRVCCAACGAPNVGGGTGEAAALDMARQLAELSGGRLVAHAAGEAFDVSMTFPALGQLPVLAVDDNVGTLNLLQRYIAGTRYRLIGVQDPEQALSMAEQVRPGIVVLDVMMPRLDGWKILGRLLEHPVVGQLPVVVCSILAQEELALALGASAYVRKPVTRQAFLTALDQETARLETESR